MDDLKEQHNSHTPNGFMQDTPPRADVDEILRRKRKAREYKVRGFVGPVCVCVCGKSNGEEETARAARATGHAAEELKRERERVYLHCRIGLRKPAHSSMAELLPHELGLTLGYAI